MSTIKDVQVAGKRQIETVKRQHEREIKRLNSEHQVRKSELHKNNDEELVDIRREHAEAVVNHGARKEKVLQEMSDNLEKTKQLTDRQINSLKLRTEKVSIEEKERLAKQREEMTQDHLLHQEDLNHRFSQKAKDIHQEGKFRIEVLKEQNENQIQDREAHYRKKLTEQNDKHLTQIRQDDTKYTQIKNSQDSEFKKNRLVANQRQQIELAQMTEQQNKNVLDRDKVFRKGLKEQDQMFEQKYAQTFKFHNENLGRLNQRNETVIAQMKSNLGEVISRAQNKSDDPFYNFTELKPIVAHQEDGVEIKVEIPEYSKQDIQLSLNGKEVILNFTRRHNDVRKAENSLNKIQKVESYNSRIVTQYQLDPKTVKSNYADGIMTYTVKKA